MLLDVIPDTTERAVVVEGLFRDADSNSQRLMLLEWFGTFPDREAKRERDNPLDEEKTECLAADLRDRVREMQPRELEAEDRLFHLAIHGVGNDAQGRQVLEGMADDSLVLALLRGCIRLDLSANQYLFDLRTAEQLFDHPFLEQCVKVLDQTDGVTPKDREILDLAKQSLGLGSEQDAPTT
jgi:hypothetical protein